MRTAADPSRRSIFPLGHDFSDFLPDLRDYMPLDYHEEGWLNYAIGDIRHVPGLDEVLSETCARVQRKLPALSNILPGMRGYRPLVDALAEVTHEETGQEINPSNVVLSNGGCSGLRAAVLTTCDPGEVVVYAEPSFPFWCVLHLTGVVLEPLVFQRPPEYSAAFADRIEEVCREHPPAAVILNEPQNPMGHLVDKGQLIKLAELAESYNFWILMDEVGRPFSFQQVKWWGSYLPVDRVIQVDSFTKRYGVPGLRLGCIVCPPRMVRPLRAVFANIQGGISHAAAEFGWQMLRVLGERPGGNPCIGEIRRRHDALSEIIRSLQNQVEIYYQEGLYGLYYPSTELGSSEVRDRSIRAKIRLMDNEFQYACPEEAPRSYRISIGGESRFPKGSIEDFVLGQGK